MAADAHGHLFLREDDGEQMGAAESGLVWGAPMSKKERTEFSLQERIELQFQEDVRVDPQRAYEKYGLTESLKRGVRRSAAIVFVLLLGLIIWIALHH
ncbi:hypothetical protein NKH70_31230 [Mesorhizobium sp. M0991]|uniref:hypothetical protein n=1 Tax=unclassified Mesorhizobium TaxID=325217 RepID=UPI003338F16A